MVTGIWSPEEEEKQDIFQTGYALCLGLLAFSFLQGFYV